MQKNLYLAAKSILWALGLHFLTNFCLISLPLSWFTLSDNDAPMPYPLLVLVLTVFFSVLTFALLIVEIPTVALVMYARKRETAKIWRVVIFLILLMYVAFFYIVLSSA